MIFDPSAISTLLDINAPTDVVQVNGVSMTGAGIFNGVRRLGPPAHATQLAVAVATGSVLAVVTGQGLSWRLPER